MIALDRGNRDVLVLIARAGERGVPLTVPATALAQVIRRPVTQARLVRFIRQPTTRLVALDGPDATATGLLLAASGTTDIVDAHVVICARRTGPAVLTSDPDDLRRLDATLRLVRV